MIRLRMFLRKFPPERTSWPPTITLPNRGRAWRRAGGRSSGKHLFFYKPIWSIFLPRNLKYILGKWKFFWLKNRRKELKEIHLCCCPITHEIWLRIYLIYPGNSKFHLCICISRYILIGVWTLVHDFWGSIRQWQAKLDLSSLFLLIQWMLMCFRGQGPPPSRHDHSVIQALNFLLFAQTPIRNQEGNNRMGFGKGSFHLAMSWWASQWSWIVNSSRLKHSP